MIRLVIGKCILEVDVDTFLLLTMCRFFTCLPVQNTPKGLPCYYFQCIAKLTHL